MILFEIEMNKFLAISKTLFACLASCIEGVGPVYFVSERWCRSLALVDSL